jgi:hypothetical protein
MKALPYALWLMSALVLARPLAADEAQRLAGKWSVKKVNDQGQSVTQTIEVKQDKFVFQVLGNDGEVRLHAEGDLKLEKLGPFDSARFMHIRGGSSPSDLNDVDDEYTCIYTLDSDTWNLVSNFDKEREQKPSLDAYHRVKAAPPAATLIIDEIEMADTPQSATWFFCFEASLGGVTRRFHAENKGYDHNHLTIPIALEIPKAQAGQKCSFKMQLDDVDADVCTEEVDNRSTGEFSVSERGSQSYKPEENWRYTLRWHLK